jgi:hypothetical protein
VKRWIRTRADFESILYNFIPRQAEKFKNILKLNCFFLAKIIDSSCMSILTLVPILRFMREEILITWFIWSILGRDLIASHTYNHNTENLGLSLITGSHNSSFTFISNSNNHVEICFVNTQLFKFQWKASICVAFVNLMIFLRSILMMVINS